MSKELRSKLATELLPATWASLRPHFQRDSLFVVDARVPLLDAATAIAEDRKALVAGWVESGALARPTREQAATWEKLEGAAFLSVVVQPFVFVQRLDDFVGPTTD